MRLEQLVDLRIGVLGYGREGRSAVAALLGARADADVTVLVEAGELPRDVPVPAIRAPFGEQLKDYSVLLRSPGVPINHPALQAYRAGGGVVVNPASIWFSERPGLEVIGVTGSKGKSTTAALLAHMLRGAGKNVVLAGNIGVPLLDHLDMPRATVVVELSSYQLADLEGYFSLGIMTRLFDEHLDWHGDRQHYFRCKLRLAELLGGNPLVINATDPVLRSATLAVPGRVESNCPPGFHRQDDRIYLDQEPLVSGRELALVGRHNLDNAALALEAGQLLGCALESLLRSLRSFRPLANRLENLATAHGRRWINDSISTSPHATRAALEALHSGGVILIAGGQARPADWQVVIDWCQSHQLLGLIVLPDNGEHIARAMIEAGVIAAQRVRQVDNLEQAVAVAVELSSPGATVVLSPGAPSFSHYRDFEERGERFRQAVTGYRDLSTA